jgi:NitT/TauT family transport system substrate-binding protein
MAEPIAIEFTRFSAFYSPLIATIAGGFLKDEGLAAKHSVSAPGKTAIAGLLDGSVDVAQSAASQGLVSLEQGKPPPALHFAQINEMDGFFLTARVPDPAFSWKKIEGRRVIVDQGSAQPFAMFKYACHKQGVDIGKVDIVDAGTTEQMIARYRKGDGDYIHLQGPGPQQLVVDGVGAIVASLGKAIGPCAFSSLAATPAFLATDKAKAFMRAYRKARAWLLATPAAEVARVEASFFPDVDRKALADTIHAYQRLGNWTPHVEITREAFETVNDVFMHAGLTTKRHAYEAVVAPPPA